MSVKNFVRLFLGLLIFHGCHSYKQAAPRMEPAVDEPSPEKATRAPSIQTFAVSHDVRMKKYFPFLDSVLAVVNKSSTVKLNEHVLVQANPWIIDTLKATDYYLKKAKGIFQVDQSDEIILRKGSSLIIPDSLAIASIDARLRSTILDLNIPEFRIRLLQQGDTILSCKVRVGRNAIQYLKLAGRDVNLRTPVGEGKIVRIARVPYQLNPETGELYEGTHRDDGGYTKMPIIPWLEPEINGIRYGDMIHPTTNPETLGKAFSHGCVGTSESDAWTIYYNCPVGTTVRFRYDLKIVNQKGDTVRLRDIYRLPPKHVE